MSELTADMVLLRVKVLREKYGREMATKRAKLRRAYQRFAEFQQGHRIRMKMLSSVEADALAIIAATD